MEPVSYPKVTLGDRVYTLKLRMGDVIRLYQEHGVDLQTRSNRTGADSTHWLFTVFAACIAHQFQADPEKMPSAIQLADMVEDRETLDVIDDAVAAAIKKALARPTATSPTA
jgi:hypothetical protein